MVGLKRALERMVAPAPFAMDDWSAVVLGSVVHAGSEIAHDGAVAFRVRIRALTTA